MTAPKVTGAAEVTVVPYDPGWPRKYEEEAFRISGVLEGVAFRIEHVGSTSIPGAHAKPLLDVMVGVSDLRLVTERVLGLEAIGYEYVPEYEALIRDRRYFRKPSQPPRRVHLHCVIEGGPGWVRTLAFRDHLRCHAGRVRKYSKFKLELAERFATDKAGYQRAKAPFIESVLREAAGTSAP